MLPPLQIDIQSARIWSAFFCRDSKEDSNSEGNVFASVRTAWDCYLTIKSYPAGSEVLVSAINIPNMFEIARSHNLRLVVLDLEVETLLPSVSELKSKISDKTACVLIAHLYGNWSNLDELSRICSEHSIDLIEDCAQCYLGSKFYGTGSANVSLFSFGLIKRNTALGGAIAFIRNEALRSKMTQLNASLPRQKLSNYLKRAVKAQILLILGHPKIYSLVCWIAVITGVNHELALRHLVRGFPNAKIPAAFRIRLRKFHENFVKYRFGSSSNFKDREELFLNLISEFPSVNVLGSKAQVRSHWLLPVSTKDKEKALTSLRLAGFDASSGITSLVQLESEHSEDLLEKIIYLPIPCSTLSSKDIKVLGRMLGVLDNL